MGGRGRREGGGRRAERWGGPRGRPGAVKSRYAEYEPPRRGEFIPRISRRSEQIFLLYLPAARRLGRHAREGRPAARGSSAAQRPTPANNLIKLIYQKMSLVQIDKYKLKSPIEIN